MISYSIVCHCSTAPLLVILYMHVYIRLVIDTCLCIQYVNRVYLVTDDSWLSLTYEELDQLLEGYQTDKAAAKDSTADADTDSKFDPSVLVESMSAFIDKKSNLLTGVEAPNR